MLKYHQASLEAHPNSTSMRWDTDMCECVHAIRDVAGPQLRTAQSLPNKSAHGGRLGPSNQAHFQECMELL